MSMATPGIRPTDTSSEAGRVLVVDDDPVVRSLHARALSLAGFGVAAVADATAALRRLREEAFDVLVTDLVMPGLRGVVLAELVQRDHPDVAIVVVSGWVGRVEQERLAAELSAPVLSKPMATLDDLVATVEAALARHDAA